jgi:hypothetical protein
MSCLSISELPADEQAELLHSKVVSLGERRLRTPSEQVRAQLDDEQRLTTHLLRRCPYSTPGEFVIAMEKARRVLGCGCSMEAALSAGEAVAERLRVERAFGDGPNSPRAA